MTTFYNFALKIGASWAKKVVKPIFETWNTANDVIVYVWFIGFLIEKLKNTCNVKKIVPNAQNLQWKTKMIETELKIKSTT